MTYTNGTGALRETGANPFSPEALGEDEWEAAGNPYAQETGFEALGENEWESQESHYANPYAQEAGFEALGEDEWEAAGNPYAQETGFEALGENEWESHESHYANPYAQEAGFEALGEDEWEATGNPYAQESAGADQFLPFLLPLAAKALPLLGKVALPAVKKLLPIGKKLVGNVVKNVMGNLGGGGAPRGRPAARRMPARRPGMARPMPGRPAAPASNRNAMIQQLMQQLGGMLNQGEQEAAALEAQLFGANEFEGELAANEAAHEAALTEVLAAEAAHTASESEAEALLSAALPITIRIMGARRALRPVMPTLMQANTRLVRGLRQGGPAGRQLSRVVPSIQRRTVASLRAAARRGQPITPGTVARVMAAQSARVLGSPHACGRALVRNTAVRQATVAPAGVPVRAARSAEF